MKHQTVHVLLIAGAVPIVVALTGAALQLSWWSELPSPVAVHWSPGGVDGTAAAWVPPVTTAALGVGLTWCSARSSSSGSARAA